MGTALSSMYTEYEHADTPEKGEADLRAEIARLDTNMLAHKSTLAVTQAHMVAIKQRSKMHAEGSVAFRQLAEEARQLNDRFRTCSAKIRLNVAMRGQVERQLAALASKDEMELPVLAIERTTPYLKVQTMTQERVKAALTEANAQQKAIAGNQMAMVKIMEDAARSAESTAAEEQRPAADAAGVFAEMDMLLSGPPDMQLSAADLRWPVMMAGEGQQQKVRVAIAATTDGASKRVSVGGGDDDDGGPGAAPPLDFSGAAASAQAPARVNADDPLGFE
jgi:hypothetical protein